MRRLGIEGRESAPSTASSPGFGNVIRGKSRITGVEDDRVPNRCGRRVARELACRQGFDDAIFHLDPHGQFFTELTKIAIELMQIQRMV